MATALRQRLLTGSIPVPPHIAPKDLAAMEREFRPLLWPPARSLGYQRYSRQFAWLDDGRTLAFTIMDVPLK